MTKKEMVTVKSWYLKPHTTIYHIAEEHAVLAASPNSSGERKLRWYAEEHAVLAASPNVRPGGDSGGSIEIVPLVPDVGSDDDVLEG